MLKRFLARCFPFLALLAATVGHCTGGEQQLPVYDFSKGVDTYHSSLSLPDGFVQDALNVFFDDKAPVTKRQGYTVAFSTKAYQFQSAWSYTDSSNTSWIIVRSSDQITANNLAGTVVKIATTSVNDLVGEVNAFGNAYFVDPTQGVYYWNGTVTTYVSGSPKGSLIQQFHGRVWVSGQAVPNGNLVNGSKYLDGTTWATGLNPNDPVQLTIGLNDNFDNVTAMYPYLDTLYITKHYSISGLYGFDQTSFQVSFLTQECGCIDQQSIQAYNHGLIFVSLRGVESFDGYTCTRISDPVKNKVDPATQSSFNTQSWLQQTQSDWNSGTFNPTNGLSSSLYAPALGLSTFTITDTNFGAGTNNNTQVLAGQVLLAVNNSGNITNPDFESSFSGNWSSSGGSFMSRIATYSGVGCTISPESGSWFVGPSPGQLSLQIKSGNTVIASTHPVSNLPLDCSWQKQVWSDPADAGKRVSINVQGFSGGTEQDITTSDTYIFSGTITYFTAHDGNGTGAIDNIQNGSSTITSGYFTSTVFDTTFSSPAVIVSISSTTNTNNIAYEIKSATASTGQFIDSGSSSAVVNRYIEYVASFTLTSSDNALSALTVGNFNYEPSSAVLVSQVHGTSGISTFGNLSISQDLSSGGNIAYAVCTAATSAMTGKVCNSITANTQITTPTNNFAQVIATFTVTASTQVPKLQSTTVQWFSGNRSPSMSSTVWDNRYWLSIATTTSDNNNDAILVANKNYMWTVFDIHAGGLTQYKGSLYHSDSLSTGNVYLDYQGYNDNGVAINAFVKTKDYSMGNLTEDDFIDSIWPSMDNLGNYNVSSSYFVDRSTTSYALSTVNQNEFGNNTSIKLPFPLDTAHQNFGKVLSYKFQATDLNEPWQFYGFREVFHSRPTQ